MSCEIVFAYLHKHVGYTQFYIAFSFVPAAMGLAVMLNECIGNSQNIMESWDSMMGELSFGHFNTDFSKKSAINICAIDRLHHRHVYFKLLI